MGRNITPSCTKQLELTFLWRQIGDKIDTQISWPWCHADLVCYTAVFSLVTQRSSPQGEVRCVTTLKTWGKVSHTQLNSCELAVGFCAEKKNKNQSGHPGNKYSPGWAKGTAAAALCAFDHVTYIVNLAEGNLNERGRKACR